MTDELATSRELDAFRTEADRFIAELDEEATSTTRATRRRFEVEPIYARHEELSRLETVQRLREAPVQLRRFACESYLGNLTRRHQERIATVEASLEATVDGRTHPLPDAARRALERARPRPPRADRARAAAAARRAFEPGLPRGRADRPRSDRAARRAERVRALPGLRLPPRRARRRVPGAARRDRAAVGARGRPPLPRAPRDPRSTRRALGRGAAPPRAGARSAVPGGSDGARARRDAHRPRHRPALAGECRARPRAPPEQERRGRSARRSRFRAA